MTPLFITIDPERDTVEVVAEYVKGKSSITLGFKWLVNLLEKKPPRRGNSPLPVRLLVDDSLARL